MTLCNTCRRHDHDCPLDGPGTIMTCIEYRAKDPIYLMEDASADEIIRTLEVNKLGWSLDHTGALIEARIWNWPWVVGRYRPPKVENLDRMLRGAIADYHEFLKDGKHR